MNKIMRTRIIATFFLIIFFPSILPLNVLYASNNGPNAPEASGFESVNATDMVNLSSGDMSYVLPLMDVGGFPVSLSYHGGVPLDLESTWTGLGWNLNTGAINRGLNASPDDWKGGNSLDFIRYQDTETIYNVNVGIGLGNAAEVGVGASWGSNKALSGSVFASIGIAGVAQASTSIDTNGNYSLGVGSGISGKNSSGFGGGISMSGNVSGGKTNFGAGIGYRSTGGLTVGLGASLDGGISASLGYSNTQENGGKITGQSGAASISMNSFSSGDWDISSKGWYIPIQIHCISFGFGQQKIKYNLAKAYMKEGFGVLYANLDSADTTNDAVENDNVVDTQFTDYQNRYRYIDAYEQSLPQTESQFVGDYDADREKLNFTFAGYDSYDVNASGISGVMNPRILENATIYGLGYKGSDPNSTDGKMRIYNHNSLTTNKSLGTNTSNDIEFYFNGQFTQNTTIPALSPLSNTNTTLQGILSARQALNNQRLRQGNYVEVFTNKQIKNGQALGLLSPLNPNGNGLTLDPLSRNTPEYKNEGIGGYKITAPDGKVYHFSQPVYHFEQVERNILKDNSEDHVSEKRQYSSYATHWLLTAITGPDFIDTNSNNIADSADFGYWVRMDYGKWSDGYAWRTPTDKSLKDYNTNIHGDIEKKDFGTYQFGRKQLYYLDRIVSATHTAFFVKDLRYDSVGADLNYFFNPSVNLTNDGTGSGAGINPQDSFAYKRQMQLMLEKIVLVKNENALVTKGNTTDALKLSYPSSGDIIKTYQPGFNSGGGFFAENGVDPVITINNESGIYDVRDFDSFDYNKALKVVDLAYNYNLAVKDHTNNLSSPDPAKSKGSPGTIAGTKNPNAGKLCLKSVKFLGRNNFDYMPPYQFEYKGEYVGSTSSYIKYPAHALVQKTATGINEYNYSGELITAAANTAIPIDDIRAKDEWGFLKDVPGQESAISAGAWTMNKIITPTGSAIEFEHEEDDFYEEAFSRRFWTDDLMFNFSKLNDKIRIKISRESGNASVENLDFTKYFKLSSKCMTDIWVCARHDYNDFGCEYRTAKVDINKEALDVISVTTDAVILECPLSRLTEYNGNPLFGRDVTLNGGNGFILESNIRGNCPNPPGCINVTDRIIIKYKILANKVPTEENGGGLRVKSITLKDENNNRYKTSYYYNVPGTNKVKNIGDYKSSGITSYSPVRGTKFIPYQSELPSPGVMYEYVTMAAENQSGTSLGETRYRFNVLKSVFDIFDENIVMTDDNGVAIFKATVTEHGADGGYLNQAKKIKAKSIKLDINTSLIGQFRSIEEFNNKGQLLSRVEKKYLSGAALKQAGINRGSMTESFQSMKSVFTTDVNDANPVLKNRFLSISSKEEYTSVLQSTVTTGPHGKKTESYSKTDPQTGAFLVVETEKSDGTKMREERVPAYTKYAEMGSKVDNLSNKNMLSQTAANYSYILDKATSTWKETGVGITTWSNIWTYKDIAGTSATPSAANEKIWRKHKSYVWNGVKDVNGIFTNYTSVTDDGFVWGVGLPQTNIKWKQTSEITLYDHYSSPLEMKDINGNYASSKMGDNDTKVTVVGNAGYSEMFFTGAENTPPVNNPTFLEPEVKMVNATRNATYYHTGKQSVAATSSTQFGIAMQSGQHRAGKYKVSVWVEKTNAAKARINNNGAIINFTETYNAGNWVLKSAYVDVPTSAYYIYLTSLDTSIVYLDDLMIRPVASSMTGYVYNQYDELTHIIGNNGLASRFEYDNAGRLIKTYSEVIDDAANTVTGGFKLVKTNVYNNRYLN